MSVESGIIGDEELLQKMVAAREGLLREIRKAIIGQDEVVEQVLISLFVGGHSIITGVPGLAKTLLVKTISSVLDLSFKRIQFTPDLMPADITGTEVIEEDRTTGKRVLQFIKGPIFANIILADEINRTPPKTQSALLEAMQEGNVTVQGVTYPLPRPFFVLAGKARAILHGRVNVSCDDIRAMAPPVLRHRILLNFQAESERVDSDEVIRRLIEAVPEPASGLS